MKRGLIMTRQILQLAAVAALIGICFFGIYLSASDQADAAHLFAPCRDSSSFSNDQFLENAVGGGPLPDGIPPAENPVYESVASAGTWLHDKDPVFVVESKEGVRLYPQPIMVWHEIVNSRFNGRAGSFTYCPLASNRRLSFSSISLSFLRLSRSLIMVPSLFMMASTAPFQWVQSGPIMLAPMRHRRPSWCQIR